MIQLDDDDDDATHTGYIDFSDKKYLTFSGVGNFGFAGNYGAVRRVHYSVTGWTDDHEMGAFFQRGIRKGEREWAGGNDRYFIVYCFLYFVLFLFRFVVF